MLVTEAKRLSTIWSFPRTPRRFLPKFENMDEIATDITRQFINTICILGFAAHIAEMNLLIFFKLNINPINIKGIAGESV